VSGDLSGNRKAQLALVAKVRKRIQEAEAEIIAQNEIIATLERSGRDAREARAVRAQLWLSHEADLAEVERLLNETDGPG
jgi:hypothetical protein